MGLAGSVTISVEAENFTTEDTENNEGTEKCTPEMRYLCTLCDLVVNYNLMRLPFWDSPFT